MSTQQIHVFISHSWSYSGHYNTLADWIFNRKWTVGQASLHFQDFSVPKNDPIHFARNDAELKAAIHAKIARSHVVVIPSGMYAHYSKWIQKEIDGANYYDKPILAVNPFGQERKAGKVLDAAKMGVGWNKKNVVSGVWNLFKGL